MVRRMGHGHRAVAQPRGWFSSRVPADAAHEAMTATLDAREASGRGWLDLTVQTPPGAPRAEGVVEAPWPTSRRDVLRSAGEAIAAHLSRRGSSVEAGQIVLAPGATSAFSLVLTALCEPGDALLAPLGTRPGLEALARTHGVRVVRPGGRFDDDHVPFDPVALYEGIDSHTRLLVVGAPAQTSGAMPTADDFEALGACGVPLLVDATHAWSLEAEGWPTWTCSSALEAPVFILGGLPPPDAPCAWIAVIGRPEVVGASVRSLRAVARTLDPLDAAVWAGVPAALAASDEVAAALRARRARNLARLRETPWMPGSSTFLPAAGWHVCLRMPPPADARGWPLALLEDEGVLVAPASAWDIPPNHVGIVLSWLVDEDVFERGLGRLVACTQGRRRPARMP